MTTEERLQTLMQRGWNIQIECKGKWREFAMTYEASGYLIPRPGATQEEITRSFYPIHAYGNTLEELVTHLEIAAAKAEGGVM
ncbi:hypothetical protein [Heyndrickxia sporothermodurans]|uniref:hypothetical protein n=1 Tax=Heyndrickxia sporothermodurans TaxID=46224 RepID=UPI000D3B4E7C|nr:hypothetical protein [Heyndrickxia sporothermodurans]PTY93078.1 hypothetical protein B5V90_03060 [Heyndrickxia sporothermodurans]